MGQRLVITVRKDYEEIAKIYFHWSAYSVSALTEAKRLIDYLEYNKDSMKDLRFKLVQYVESKGGCIQGGEGSQEWEYITSLFPNNKFKTTGSRNDGLIALSQRGMDDLQGWSEGDILIDLDDEVITNEVYWINSEDTYEEMRKDYKDYDDSLPSFEDIPELDINIEDIKFSDLDYVIETLSNFNDYKFKNKGMVYELIA